MTKPGFLYGTAWKEVRTEACVLQALEAGFRGIDTANQRKHYHEEGVGLALDAAYARKLVARGDLFLQTKFTSLGGQDHRLPYESEASPAEQVRQSFASSLKHLRTDYLDSYVLHGPTTARGLSPHDREVWVAMETLHAEGKAKSLGVSNVSLEQLETLFELAKVPPAFVQNRCFARRAWDRDIRALCRERGTVYQGFSLLTANEGVFHHPRFLELLRRVGCTPAQAVFRFALGVGMLPLTGTTDPAHMREDLASPRVELSTEDLRVIEELLV